MNFGQERMSDGIGGADRGSGNTTDPGGNLEVVQIMKHERPLRKMSESSESQSAVWLFLWEGVQ